MTYDLENLPRRIDYKRAAKLVSQHFFPISHRTLERWPLPRLKVNGKNTLETADVFAEAEARLEAARK
jgi:hypothetical protein